MPTSSTPSSEAAADRRWPGDVTGLRTALAGLHRWIEADRRWDGRFPGANLTRHTVLLALDAEPGALHDLARHVAADLTAAGHELPGPVCFITAELRATLSMLH